MQNFLSRFYKWKTKGADNGALEMQSERWKKVLGDKFPQDMEDPLIFFIHLLFFLFETETRNGIS